MTDKLKQYYSEERNELECQTNGLNPAKMNMYEKTVPLSFEKQSEWIRKIILLRQEYYSAIEQLLNLVKSPAIDKLKNNLIKIYQSNRKKPRTIKLDTLNDLITFFTHYELNSFFLETLETITVDQIKQQTDFQSAKQTVKDKDHIYTETINAFLDHFQKLLYKISYAYAPNTWQNELREDAAQEGWIALRRSIEFYNPDKEKDQVKQASFLSYSIKAVRNRIKYFVKTDKTIRPPQHMIDWEQEVNAAINNYKNLNNGQEPSLAELSAATGFSSDKITNILLRQYGTASLHTPKRKKEYNVETQDSYYEDILHDPKAELAFSTVENNIDKNRFLQKIEDILQNSPVIWPSGTKNTEFARNRAAQVFSLYFREQQKFTEIALKLGITKQSVSDIFKKIFMALKQSDKIDQNIVEAIEKFIKYNRSF